ncbi:SigE family RNA polymerase sigma factor [Nocardioides albidus]|uniref:SigE family RNA polymerase sigma factor n=1 Tax=Nocardioides albidus TaxID=1517589 RepID=A0A5C4VYU8_9ACTN|nr:SigE family RNA polymerase sigma factor [Nocardioides albidus]TNM41152.1 SigE family RNA polymerase sigma factor [Nocardioides albidus]
MDTLGTAPPPASFVQEVLVDDEQEYADLYAAQWPRLYRMARAVAGDDATAEDAVQAAFARAYASWGRVRRADHPEAYLRRMVLNEILGLRRRAWARRERPHASVDGGLTTEAPDRAITERDRMWSAVRDLPPRQRAVIVLRYYEDLSEEQIATALGCSRGTVKSQAAAALANLRRCGALTTGDDA